MNSILDSLKGVELPTVKVQASIDTESIINLCLGIVAAGTVLMLVWMLVIKKV